MDRIDDAALDPVLHPQEPGDGEEPLDPVGPGNEGGSPAGAKVAHEEEKPDAQIDHEEEKSPLDGNPEGLHVALAHAVAP